jgi:hypothetical protein
MNKDEVRKTLIDFTDYLQDRYWLNTADCDLLVDGFLKSINESLNEVPALSANEHQDKICVHCGKYKKMQGNGIMHQLCECGE